jgi:hypothetical protein
VAPVVVNPETDSNTAPATVGATPVAMNGMAPAATTTSHPRPTMAIPSRVLIEISRGVNHQSSPPVSAVPSVVTAQGIVRPSNTAITLGGTIATATHTSSAPTM